MLLPDLGIPPATLPRPLDLPPEVQHAVALMQTWGIPTWLVGGSVRDLLLGRLTHDFDFVLAGDGLEAARRIADALHQPFVALDERRRFGRVVVPRPDAPDLYIDFAQLTGGSLAADLAQRDFTINALAVPAGEGIAAVVDHHGGLDDLRSRTIRAVSDRAFDQDPVRVLRAVRFQAELGFRLDPQTERVLADRASRLRFVAWERIRDEMCRILVAHGATRWLRYLHTTGVLPALFPELARLDGVEQSPPHWQDVWQHTLQVVTELESVLTLGMADDPPWEPAPGSLAPAFAYESLRRVLVRWQPALCQHLSTPTGYGRDRRLLLKWAALLHDVGKPLARQVEPDGRIRFKGHDLAGSTLAGAMTARLRLNREEVEAVETIVRCHMRPSLLSAEPQLTRRAIHRFFRDVGDEGVDVVLLSLADRLASRGADLEPAHWEQRLGVAMTLLEHYYRHGEVIDPPRLLTGDDLIVLGMEPGPKVGQALLELAEAQAEGGVCSREEALIWAREWMNHQPSSSGQTALQLQEQEHE